MESKPQLISRLRSIRRLARPLALLFVGVVVLSIGVGYFVTFLYRNVALPPLFGVITLQFLPLWIRGLLFLTLGLGAIGVALWRLSDLAVISLEAAPNSGEVVVGLGRARGAPQMVVISGGSGVLITASLGHIVSRLTCITPVQDSVEYYYRASSLFSFENVTFVVPTPAPLDVELTLNSGARTDVRSKRSHDERFAQQHVVDMRLVSADQQPVEVTQATLDAIAEADVIILGPGSLFEGILPNLLIPRLRDALRASSAMTIYICSLMTEPGMTTGFGVGEHIRQIVRFGGFAPDYVLVNAQRIDSEVRQVYAAANQTPVFLALEELEETTVSATDQITTRDILLDGSVVIEADLTTSVVQLTASLDNPNERRTVRVLRHDPEKLASAILEVLRRA